MSVHVSGHGRAERGHPDHDDDERIGALTSPLGKQQRPLTACPAGTICAVAKLSHRGDRRHAVVAGTAAAHGAVVDA